MGPILFSPADNASVGFDWTEFLPAGVTLSTVTHTVDSPLVKGTEATDAGAGTSLVKVSGAVHGGLYMAHGTALLSNGDTFKRSWPIRAMEGI